MEMATRLHADVGGARLAHAKFAKMAADINAIMPWFETFLKLRQTADD